MLRQRLLHSGAVLHVTQRGHNRQPVFACADDYAFYLECLTQAAGKLDAAIHAYVLMTNHVHSSSRAPTRTRCRARTGRREALRAPIQCPHRCKWQPVGRAVPLCRHRLGRVPSHVHALHRAESSPGGHRGPSRGPCWSSFRANALGESRRGRARARHYDALAGTPDGRRRAYRSLFEQPLSEDTLQPSACNRPARPAYRHPLLWQYLL